MVWKSTRRVGMAIAENSCGYTSIVAHYRQEGNIDGDYEENVSDRCRVTHIRMSDVRCK